MDMATEALCLLIRLLAPTDTAARETSAWAKHRVKTLKQTHDARRAFTLVLQEFVSETFRSNNDESWVVVSGNGDDVVTTQVFEGGTLAPGKING